MKKTYSAPSSLILSGEYSYQYGKPILSCAVEDRAFVTGSSAKGNQSAGINALLRDLYVFLEKKRIHSRYLQKQPSFEVTLPNALYGKYAVRIALARALFDLTAPKTPLETVHEFAYQTLKKETKLLTDVESSASCFGGLILYRKEFEFLKYISRLNILIPRIIEENLIYFPVDYPLKRLRQKIDNEYANNPEKIEFLLMKTEKMTRRLVLSFIKEDVHFFVETINNFQMELEHLNFVPEDLMKLCQSVRSFGGGAKIVFDSFSEESKAFLLVSRNKKIDERLKKRKNCVYTLSAGEARVNYPDQVS